MTVALSALYQIEKHNRKIDRALNVIFNSKSERNNSIAEATLENEWNFL